MAITYSYWTSEVGSDKACGYIKEYERNTFIVGLVNLNTTTVNTLNDYATRKKWNKWLLNINNKLVTLNVNNGKRLQSFFTANSSS